MSLSGNAEKVMMSKPDAWGKGIKYLNIIINTYKEAFQRADLLKKEQEHTQLFQKNNETIDDFAARCIELRNQLQSHGIRTTDKGFRDRFVLGLGPIFTEIQQM